MTRRRRRHEPAILVLALLFGSSASANDDRCAVAGPACFGACPRDYVASASGQCLPRSPPRTTSKTVGGLEVEAVKPPPPAPVGGVEPEKTPDAEASDQPDAETEASPPAADGDLPAAAPRPCCLVWLTVRAVGLKNLGPRASRKPLKADVRINGQFVGSTPMTDALPAGDYRVEVVGVDGSIYAETVALRPGTHRAATAEVLLSLDPTETRARAAWRKARFEQARARERLELAAQNKLEERARARKQAELDARRRRWEAETRPLRQERRKKRGFGGLLIGVGGALMVTGTALEIAARNSHDDAKDAAARWRSATRDEDRTRHAADVQSAQDRRDARNVAGLTTLGLGAVGLTTGALLLLSIPTVPKEPGPRDAGTARRPSIEFAPWVSRGSLGAVWKLTL